MTYHRSTFSVGNCKQFVKQLLIALLYGLILLYKEVKLSFRH